MIDGIWQDFLNTIKEEKGSRVVDTWFKAVSPHQWDSLNKVVYLKTPNSFVKKWLQDNYMPIVQSYLGRLLNVDSPKIVFMDSPKDVVFAPAIISQSTEVVKKQKTKITGYLNANYRFENFVVGPNNSLACAASQAVSSKPGQLYNPLYIYGGSGLGKTHLLHAIANDLRSRNDKAVIVYQTADRFINEFINAIRFNKMHKFELKYKDIDLLLVDDIQFISNKDQTQEAFFHIFNTLYESHKQIVFSSDKSPQEIRGLEERLCSRLQWGLVADVQIPSLETKIAILKRKAEAGNEIVGDDIINFIATSQFTNIRELEGALIRVLAFASLTDQKLSLELAQRVLARNKVSNDRKAVGLDEVATCICKHYSCTLSELRSKDRSSDLSLARQVAMYTMKKLTNKSLIDIGEFFNRGDHTTVLYAIKRIRNNQSSEFKNLLKRIEREILT